MSTVNQLAIWRVDDELNSKKGTSSRGGGWVLVGVNGGHQVSGQMKRVRKNTLWDRVDRASTKLMH